MKNSIIFIATLVAALLVNISVKAQGPWLHKKNDGFIQVQSIVPVYQYSALLNGVFIKDQQAINRRTFNSDYSLYIEYGITDKLNVISHLPLKYISTGELTASEAPIPDLLDAGNLLGLSNYSLSLKYQVVDKNVKVAVSAISRWNTISQNLEKGLATGFDANAFGLMIHAGRGNEKHYGFIAAGYLKYTNGFSDAIEVNIEHGWNLGEKWNLALAFNSRFSLYNGSYVNANLDQTGFYPNNQEYAAISVKAAYDLGNGFGLNATIPMVPIYFNKVGFSGTFGFGLYKKF